MNYEIARLKETINRLVGDLDTSEKARQQGWNEANHFRNAIQDIADQPCRHHLLYDSEPCTEKFPDREKWCMTCRARKALEEKP